MSSADETLKRIRSIVRGSGDRAERARKVADVARSLGNYRWGWSVRRRRGSGVDHCLEWGAYSSASSGASGGAYREAGGGCRQDAGATKTRDRQRDGLKAVSTKAVLELSDNEGTYGIRNS
jgi:hypothetical protein